MHEFKDFKMIYPNGKAATYKGCIKCGTIKVSNVCK